MPGVPIAMGPAKKGQPDLGVMIEKLAICLITMDSAPRGQTRKGKGERISREGVDVISSKHGKKALAQDK